ncbi:MAG: hypothetical protein CM15mP104_1900 [Gammaproteobacteria bacterium]|nr:MAG: hypothetical protein CM15mP104_1900 [Gammaproteobacteria bacterium]
MKISYNEKFGWVKKISPLECKPWWIWRFLKFAIADIPESETFCRW